MSSIDITALTSRSFFLILLYMAKKTISEKEGFFEKILGSIFRSNDPEAERKRQLKNIAKELSKSKYKFYKPGSGEALPGMAKFFFDIYKTVAAAQSMLYAGQTSNVVQNIIIESVFTEKQRKIAPRITEESIREQANTVPVKVLVKQVKDELAAFIADFDNNKIAAVDMLYSRFIALSSFVGFDYHFLLKKFDSSLQERNFSYTPHFETIRGEYVVDDLKDFISIAWPLPMDSSWADTFAVIKAYREVEPVALGAWNKLMSRMQDLKNSRILEKIIQHGSKDPSYNAVYTVDSQSIAAPYIEKLKTQTELVLKKIEGWP